MSTTAVTVREIAQENPSSIRVFESFGIDYCCGGRRGLEDVCHEKNLDPAAVLAAIEEAAQSREASGKDWSRETLEALSQHIIATHHAYVRRELPRLAELGAKVANRHGELHPELHNITALVTTLDEELTQHLAKEEAILFPFVALLEKAQTLQGDAPCTCFHTVASPISQMEAEHDAAGMLLASIRSLSTDYTLPEDACPTYHAYFDALQQFERDLHQHIHLENNLLFPRAIALEQSLR